MIENPFTQPQRCMCCDRLIPPERLRWLEYDQRTGRYVDPELVTVPEEKSQGLFPFGQTCAKRALTKETP